MFVFPYLNNADGQTHTLAAKEVIWTNLDATHSSKKKTTKKKEGFFAFMKLLLIIDINTMDVHLFPRTAHRQVAL